MFADVVGYSRLTGQDEVGTWRRLRHLLREVVRPHVRSHAGRIVRIKGDGILVEFPSAVEAVTSAVALQRAMNERNADLSSAQRIELRIGINIGDVITNDNDVQGDGVNIACRLESLADPGGICISATVHEHVQGKLTYAFENRGQRALKNIASPVLIYSLGPEAIASLPKDAVLSDAHATFRRSFIAAVVVGCLSATVLWFTWRYGDERAQSRDEEIRSSGQLSSSIAARRSVPARSIVVLPFRAHDSDQDYFAEGITEDLTTDLSRIPGSFVIAPSTAFEYKGKPIDVRQVGRELSVRYALQGSVRRITDSVRINAHLVDTTNALQLWADRFDGDVSQLVKVQDHVTRRIAAALDVALIDAESQPALRGRPKNPEVVDLTMRGSALLKAQASRESTQRARELFETALRLNPDHLAALNGLAQAMVIQWQSTWYPRSGDEHLRELDSIVNRALAVKPDDAFANYFHGYVLKRLPKDLA